MKRICLSLFALFGACVCRAGGTLVIAGGALSGSNTAVLDSYVAALPDAGPVVVIPVASGQPARSARSFADALAGLGVDPARIRLFPLAVQDDSDTADVDESTWSANAWDATRLAGLEQAAGFWFTGGDQMRIVASLRKHDDAESPLLALVRRRLDAGAVVGGTSAGAAVMSETMIAGGDSLRALLEPLAQGYAATEDQDSGRLYLARGLGFLPAGIVDQHFDRKARLGRLARALAETGEVRGYGVDEDTAMVVDLASGQARVVGSGTVSLLDARPAHFDMEAQHLVAGLELSVAATGVHFELQTLALTDGLGKSTRGSEYFHHQPLQGGGMALANPLLDQLLGYDLLDNDKSAQVRRYSLDESGRVLVYTFTETDTSQAYWQAVGTEDRYAVSRVRFDISKVNFNPQITVQQTGNISPKEKFQ